jgi:hypothetical protein
MIKMSGYESKLKKPRKVLSYTLRNTITSGQKYHPALPEEMKRYDRLG